MNTQPLVKGETVVDDDFDDETVTGWESLGNSLGATHNITETGTTLTSEVVATQGNLNTNRGIVSTASFNPVADPTGFSMTFVVERQGDLIPGANGMFLGLTSSNSIFFRTTGVSSFGLVFYGQPARTQSQGGVSLVTNDIGAGGPATEGLILDANPDSIELSSFQDGFTASIDAGDSGWSFTISDISDLEGNPTTMTKSGTWEAAGTDYATVFGEAPSWFVLASNQGDPSNDTHTVVYEKISLTTGLAGSTPLQISSITPSLTGDEPSVTLRWNSVPGTEYAIDYSTDLDEDNWVEVTDSFRATDEQSEFVHSLLPDFPDLLATPNVFYRIRSLQ